MNAGDQAEGLRRLFGRRRTRVAAVVACRPRVGRTTLVVNLAAALAHNGRSVLVLDGNHGLGNVADRLGLRPRYELAHALSGDRAFADILVRSAHGLVVVPAARGLRMLEEPGRLEGEALAAFARALAASDVVLVDAASRGAAFTLPLAAPRETILAMAAATDDITGTYACIKELALREPAPRVSLAVCGARRETAALTAIGNLAEVAARHLRVRVTSLGVLNRDPVFADAARSGRAVPDAFQRSRAATQLASMAARFEAADLDRLPARCAPVPTGAYA